MTVTPAWVFPSVAVANHPFPMPRGLLLGLQKQPRVSPSGGSPLAWEEGTASGGPLWISGHPLPALLLGFSRLRWHFCGLLSCGRRLRASEVGPGLTQLHTPRPCLQTRPPQRSRESPPDNCFEGAGLALCSPTPNLARNEGRLCGEGEVLCELRLKYEHFPQA